MRRILKRRPSPAMVVALIALFVAMGGVSYGVATGSIDGREIKNNTVRAATYAITTSAARTYGRARSVAVTLRPTR